MLSSLPAESVQCVVSSPPYYALRSYLDATHPDKHREIGSEPTPDEYLATMVAVFREVRRVLRRDGTCWVNMGDSYVSGQGGRQSAVAELPKAIRRDRPEPRQRDDVDVMGWSERAMSPRTYPSRDTGLKPKDLLLMPARLALALQADGWWVRSDIMWQSRTRCRRA